VLEAIDPAAAILEFAEVNHVDHIIIGARGASLLRTLPGSVSSKVAAEAGCSVTVVRPPRLASLREQASDGKPNEMPSGLSSSEQYRTDPDQIPCSICCVAQCQGI
jgi:eukaryotic-like serine/threonine-protein kinase